MVDDPSVEDKGGFEFASGMDIFSEPGVLKACFAMEPVTFGAGAALADVPRWMVDNGAYAYITAGNKILECSSLSGQPWNLFLTNSNGSNRGLALWNGYVMYAALDKIGRAPINDGASKNDNYISGLDLNVDFNPMVQQGGTLKIGDGRYVGSLDEAFAYTAQALKLPESYETLALADFLGSLFVASKYGPGSGSVTVQDSSVFAWRGTVLSAGSALPDSVYPMKMRGMRALLPDGRTLYGFPDKTGDVVVFDGAGFVLFRKIHPLAVQDSIVVNPGAVAQHLDTHLFAGDSTYSPGVYQMKDGALCQAFVPSVATPGESELVNIGLVKSAFNGIVFIGYYRASDGSYHLEKSNASARQNNAMVRTLWHRAGTDRFKRWAGVKLNLEPLASGCAVAVHYRTSRNAAFTDSGFTITPANQDKPIYFTAQPRAREIQFKFVYMTNAENTPELLSYDPIFEVLSTMR